MREENEPPMVVLSATCGLSKTNVADPSGRMRSFAMERLACVSLPAFPLQLLFRRHPDWVFCPTVVVAEDKPQGSILWVNHKARQLGVLPGLRYAAALSLAVGLRAAEVAPSEIAQAVADLTHRLMCF